MSKRSQERDEAARAERDHGARVERRDEGAPRRIEAPVWTSPIPLTGVDGLTLPDVLPAPDAAPDDRALVDGPTGEPMTFGELTRETERTGAELAAHGFAAGDVLALWAPNAPAWAVAALAAVRAGGAVTGVPPAATASEAAAQMADARASLLATAPPLAGPAHAASAEAGVPAVVVLDAAPTPLAAGGAAPPGLRDPGGLALLPYSSGTTGLPKGVMLTDRNLVAAVRQVGCGLGLRRGDVVLAVAPFAHVMGFVVSLAAPLAAGATVVTMPRFDLEQVLALVERERITVLPVPPPVMAALARHPAVDGYDLSSLSLVVSGGAPLGADLQQAVAARLPHAAVGQGYGLTETAVGITMPDRRTGTPPGSVGRVMPGTELRVVDPETGRDAGAGRPGELWARGPQVMAGYLRRPEATAEVLGPEGWLCTGDLGMVRRDGTVVVLDRLKELIKVNAYQVTPAELEALLLTHPHVADAAVIPRPSDRTGEVPVAVVVPRGRLDPDGLRAWVAERVAPHKRIAAVRVAEQIPRTPAGKVLRRRLVEEDRAALAPVA